MLSCYWVQPAQLHPWFKPATLKRKSPSMSLRSELPSPSDEDVPDARIKRPRRTTTLTLGEHTRPQKRKLPSCPQSPTEVEAEEEDLATSSIKRQRCTALEHGISRLSLTPPGIPAPAPPPPEFATRLPTPSVTTDFQWRLPALPLAAVTTPSFQEISPPPNVEPVLFSASTDPIEDIKMRSSSWYEPEKDRIIVTDLDASSDDEDSVDDVPKLPRAVLKALLRGGPLPAAREDMLLAGLLPSTFAPSRSLESLPSPPTSPPPLDLAGFFPGPGSSDEAMDVE